jgi:hypothetical protein
MSIPPTERLAVWGRASALRVLPGALMASLPLALGGILLTAFARPRDAGVMPPSPQADRLSRLVFLLVPGAYDLFRGKPTRGYVAFVCFVTASVAALFFDIDAPAAGLLEPHLTSSVDWSFSLVLPRSDGGRAEHWALVGAIGSVRRLWAFLVAAATVCLVLHASRLPVVFRLPRAAAPEPGVLPRWLREAGAGLILCQVAGFLGVASAVHLARVGLSRAAELAVMGAAMLGLGLLLSVAWSAAAVFCLWRRRPASPVRREAAQLLWLGLEALGVAALLAREIVS